MKYVTIWNKSTIYYAEDISIVVGVCPTGIMMIHINSYGVDTLVEKYKETVAPSDVLSGEYSTALSTSGGAFLSEIMEKREKQTIKTKAINQEWIRKNLSKSDDNVYRYLLFAQGGNDHCWSSIKCICEKTNYSKQSVISSLKKLVIIGLIEKMKSPKKSRGHGYKVKKLDLLKIEDLDKGKENITLKVKKTLPTRSSKLHPEGKEYFTYEGQVYLMNDQQIQWFEKFLSKTKLLKKNTKGNHQIETTKDIIINCLVGDLSEAENQPACPPSVDEVPQLASLVSEPHKSEPTVPLKDEIKKMNDHLKADIERYYKEKKKAVVEEDPVFDGLDTPYTRPEVPPERKEYKNYYNA